MSVSVDNDPHDEGDDARGVLASWLDDYSSGRCDRADMQESFLSICRSNPDAPWDALALLDQYQRRGRIDQALARSLKTDIAQLVFGVANQTPPEGSGDTTEATLDTTGSRWRKLLAERDPGTINVEPAFSDPSVFKRDFDPMTRPPPAAMKPVLDEDRTIESRQPREHRESREPRGREPAETREPREFREPRETRPSASSDVLRDRYELLSILGRGSTGTVYRALDRHRAHLSEAARCVAVKVLKLNYRDRPEALGELEREFHQAQSLSHPNIVSAFDLDRDGDTYFIVMELLEGALLAEVLRDLGGRPMARAHALGIISSVGAALAYAHRREIVHADLKPRNIMITSSGEVKVLDFGFARNRPLELHSASALHDVPIPAPAYASVERVNGSQPHPSDDVYSLACIAYELLSGRHPFGGRSAVLARAHGRSPQRVPGLSHKQSQSLQRALLWTRGERKIDVVELLSGLGCAETPNRLVPPDELLIPDDSGWRVRRAMIGAAVATLAAIVGAYLFWKFEPPVESAAAPVTQPPVDREQQANPQGSEGAPPAAAAESTGQPPAVNPRVTGPQVAPGKKTAALPAASSPQSRPAPSANPPAAPAEKVPAGPVTIEFEKDTYVASESDGSVRLTVRREGSTRGAVSFRWTLRGNSAEPGQDFANIGPATETIPAGAREAHITIPLVSDAVTETTELFLVEIEPMQDNVSLGERSHAAVIIVDDD